MVARGKRVEDWVFGEEGNLLAIGNTAIIRFGRNPSVGQWRLQGGGVIVMMELFWMFRLRFSAYELSQWYYQAFKICCKRTHPWGNATARVAAQLRYQEFGHYGHRSGRSVGR